MSTWRATSSLLRILVLCVLALPSCGKSTPAGDKKQEHKAMATNPAAKPAANEKTREAPPAAETELATFGAGCFWCVEAVFQQLEGVVAVESGYAGGTVENPTYRQVCSGATGHAEVCQIRYDPAKISYDKLLEVFWQTHDPTTLNRQGADVGTQYRSVVFYHDDQQRAQAEKRKRELDAAGIWDAPMVTEISPLLKFYKAEDYHQNYFRTNPQERYCQVVIRPKVEKFRKVFQDALQKE
ncbi:MAG TPA: peptide-methionine (S)-S-oxide reductase MsrA [Candidatus Anammoximicrobium sp.]|nr:peptide-methionine (S)-S-oxide reductase MsrA [Candidatus Anammoximicrobium sp.]